MREERRALWEEFKGTRCQCGQLKKAFKSFCWDCYRALPKAKQQALFQRFGAGYEQAYEAALETLGCGTK